MAEIKPFVDFVIVGAMKSGTTTLADILSRHSRISFCSTKEPQFFSESPEWRTEIETYKRLFSVDDGAKLRGEASTGYTMFPEFNKRVWDDIYAFNPAMKIIYIMRDPIERVISHYMHNYMRGYTRKSFELAVSCEPEYINRSRYFTQIKPYIDNFGRHQVLLLTFENFLHEKERVLDSVAAFLQVENCFPDFDQVHSNKARQEVNITHNRYLRGKIKGRFLSSILNELYKKIYRLKPVQPIMTEATREVLWRMLEQDVDNIEKVMGRKLNEWPSCVKFKYSAESRVSAFPTA